MSKPRKPIAELIEELAPGSRTTTTVRRFPDRLLPDPREAPGADELEDIGYETIGGMGWHELDLLGRVLTAIDGKR